MFRRPPTTWRLIALALASLLGAATAAAVEVRQPEAGAPFDITLVRAYAPCLVPNTVARNGAAACDAPVTSACSVSGWDVEIVPPDLAFDPIVPFIRRPRSPAFEVIGSAPVCDAPDAPFALAVRTSTDVDAEDLPCISGHCTFPDATLPSFATAGGDVDPSYEILSTTVTGPDGLPLAGFGVARGIPEPSVVNVTVPYEPCLAPESGGACNLVRPAATCDFESGEIHWPPLGSFGAPSVRVVLRDLAGTSPRCTTGTYRLEASLRVTGPVCGTASDPASCTVVDRVVSVPLPVHGRHVDATASFDLENLGRYVNSQIFNVGMASVRIIDPTGATMAVQGITGVRSLHRPHVAIHRDQLRVRATIPVSAQTPVVDPTTAGGFTLTLSDRDGPFYTVTIPELRWQDQSPLGSRWTYADKGGVIGGVRKANLKRIGKAGTLFGYKLDLKAAGVDLSGADVPSITVAVAVARPGDLGDPEIHRAQRSCTGILKPGPRISCR